MKKSTILKMHSFFLVLLAACFVIIALDWFATMVIPENINSGPNSIVAIYKNYVF